MSEQHLIDMTGKVVLITGVPKFRSLAAPHSPFAARLNKSQSGTKLLFESVQTLDTCVTSVAAGLAADA